MDDAGTLGAPSLAFAQRRARRISGSLRAGDAGQRGQSADCGVGLAGRAGGRQAAAIVLLGLLPRSPDLRPHDGRRARPLAIRLGPQGARVEDADRAARLARRAHRGPALFRAAALAVWSGPAEPPILSGELPGIYTPIAGQRGLSFSTWMDALESRGLEVADRRAARARRGVPPRLANPQRQLRRGGRQGGRRTRGAAPSRRHRRSPGAGSARRPSSPHGRGGRRHPGPA